MATELELKIAMDLSHEIQGFMSSINNDILDSIEDRELKEELIGILAQADSAFFKACMRKKVALLKTKKAA